MGSAYAVLNIQQNEQVSEDQKLQDLSHQINWCEFSEVFHAWNNMPTWCQHCHKEGYTKFECHESKARIICYCCQQDDHRSFECPHRNSTINANKKNRKSDQTKQPLTMKVIDQSNIISDSYEGPNDSNYKHKEMEEMLVSSDKKEQVIDLEEI
jgi:hypothetical protein